MSSTSIGRDAENYVAKQLERQGYKLVDQNWRTRWCEIDLIMSKKNIVYFIEVKYRSNTQFGSGLEYITPKKLRQMQFAAEYWLSSQDWDGGSALCAIEVGMDLDDEVELIEVL